MGSVYSYSEQNVNPIYHKKPFWGARGGGGEQACAHKTRCTYTTYTEADPFSFSQMKYDNGLRATA
jgi:hypothetical protein